MALVLPDRLCAALLHEQSAFHFLQHTTPSLRQFGLELVAAGSKFCEAGQLRHGLRCLRTAYSLYEVSSQHLSEDNEFTSDCFLQNRGWGEIGDSLHIKLARCSFLLGNHEQCLSYFQNLFSDCHQSPPLQNTLLREFIHVAAQIEEATSSDLVPAHLPVPEVNQSSVRLFLASYDPSRFDILFCFVSDDADADADADYPHAAAGRKSSGSPFKAVFSATCPPLPRPSHLRDQYQLFKVSALH